MLTCLAKRDPKSFRAPRACVFSRGFLTPVRGVPPKSRDQHNNNSNNKTPATTTQTTTTATATTTTTQQQQSCAHAWGSFNNRDWCKKKIDGKSSENGNHFGVGDTTWVCVVWICFCFVFPFCLFLNVLENVFVLWHSQVGNSSSTEILGFIARPIVFHWEFDGRFGDGHDISWNTLREIPLQ